MTCNFSAWNSKPSIISFQFTLLGVSSTILITCDLCLLWAYASLIAHLPAMQETWFDSWVGKIPWRRDRLPTPVFLGFPCSSAGKESARNARDLSLIPGLGRSPGEAKGYPLQYSGLGNSMDCIVHGVTKSQTWLSDFHFTCILFWALTYFIPSTYYSFPVFPLSETVS